MQTASIRTLKHQDRQEIQEGLHKAATKQKGDRDQGVRTVVSALSNGQTKLKTEAMQLSFMYLVNCAAFTR